MNLRTLILRKRNLWKMKTIKIHKTKFLSGCLAFTFFLLFNFILSENVIAQAVVDSFDLPSGYPLNQLRQKNTLKVDPSNNVLIGFQRIGAGKFDGANWTVYDTLNGLPSNNVLSFAFTGNDAWIGTDKGLAKYNGSSFIIYDTSNSGLTTNYILSLFANGNNLWIGTRNGAFVFDGTNWTHYLTSNSGLPSDTINCFTKSGNDTIWLGTNNGVAKFFNSNWSAYHLLNYELPVVRLRPDLSGNIWIENLNEKIYILQNDSIMNLAMYYLLCSNVNPSGSILGINHFGNMVLGNGSITEIELNLQNAWKYTYPLWPNIVNGNIIAVNDLGTNDVIWTCRTFTGLQKLISISDYHGYAQLILPDLNCNTLDVNQVQAVIWNNGSLFWDLVGNAQYEVPKGSGTHSIFTDGFWIGGIDPTGKLHLAAQTYRQSGSDFWPGPLDTTNARTDSATTSQYDAIWKINRYQINEFIAQYAAGNVTNGTYTIPDIILNWPAHGTGNYSRQLAPFVDFDLNGIYDPHHGDYPDIKGDQMLWFVFNDNYRNHSETDGMPLGVEVQCSAYAYSCPNVHDSDEVINYTTFFHYRIINRSDTNYTQVYIAKFTDTDLGNYLDDYVGCDTLLNLAYTYNGDNVDDGITGYGSNPPMQNLLYLTDTMTHFVCYNGDGTAMGNPNSPVQYYQRMYSRWKDSTHVTFGGNGFGSGFGATTIPTNYMFSSNPYDISLPSWNEIIAGNSPDDRRLLTSTGPFDFPAHSVKEIDYAYVWTRDADHPNGLTTSWAKNVHDVLKIKQWFALDSFPCNNIGIGIQETENPRLNFSLFPNPARQQLTLLISSKLNSSYRMELTDIAGRVIRNGIIFSNVNNPMTLEGIAPGIYFVRVSDKMHSEVKRFIRQ